MATVAKVQLIVQMNFCTEFWDIIVITTAHSKLKAALESECSNFSARKCLPPHDELIVIEDPSNPVDNDKSTRKTVGSGGATLNAILNAAETISAKKGNSMINPDDLKQSRILIVPVGRPSEQQWLVHPQTELLRFPPDQLKRFTRAVPPHVLEKLIWPVSPLLVAIWNSTKLAGLVANGIWISSFDCCLAIEDGPGIPLPFPPEDDYIKVFTVKMPYSEAASHGVVLDDGKGCVENILYRPKCNQVGLAADNATEVNVLSGQLYVSPSAAEMLLALHVQTQYTHCTSHAPDLRLQPFSVSLYFDLLTALCSGVSRESFVSAREDNCYSNSHFDSQDHQLRVLARTQAWDKLCGLTLYTSPLPRVEFCYINTNRLQVAKSVLSSVKFNPRKLNCVVKGTLLPEESTLLPIEEQLINVNERQQLFSDCSIGRNWAVSVGLGTTAIGLHLPDCPLPKTISLHSHLVWQQCSLCWDSFGAETPSTPLIICHGTHDGESGRMFGMPLARVLDRLGLTEEDAWPGNTPRLPVHAKLFTNALPVGDQISRLGSIWSCEKQPTTGKPGPLFSISDALHQCDFAAFSSYRKLLLRSIVSQLVDGMKSYSKSVDIKRYLLHCQETDHFLWIFDCLNAKAIEIAQAKEEEGWQVLLTRLLALAADVLSAEAGWRGNIRTGPADNKLFSSAFRELHEGSLCSALSSLQQSCSAFCGAERSALLLTRAARHYQRAVHLLISRLILESTASFKPSLSVSLPPSPPSPGLWVVGLCPARLDLAGGWTDTPPICYELGGAVLNVAIKVNGVKPIRVAGRWSDTSGGLVCVLRNAGSKGGQEQVLRLHWTEVADLKDYHNPLTVGALVKSALVYTKIVDLEGGETLQEQLDRFGGSLELEISSALPPGSGLGGSSLIGEALLAVLAVLIGKEVVSGSALLHGVLALEQLMTTGGGWQDQIGGLYGGFKLGVSRAKLPCRIDCYKVPVEKTFVQTVNKHLILCYTGQVRLAKNLLQSVVRSWYSGDEALFDTFSRLRVCAVKAAEAVSQGSLTGLGNKINEYWSIKKTVAPGSEPAKVTKLLEQLSPELLGASLAGAGGGGYLYALLKEPSEGNVKIPSILLEEIKQSNDQVTFDDVSVDMTGLVVTRGGQQTLAFGSPEESFSSFLQKYEESGFF